MDNEKICAVISGGAYSPPEGIDGCAYTIACDRGYAHALRAGVRPDLILGDFDSYTGALPEGAEILRLPVEKDDTDTMSAVRHALALGYRHIRIYCALGGRLDHTLANLQTCVQAAACGAVVRILDETAEIDFLTGGHLRIRKRPRWSLSVFSMSDRCTGVCLRGVKYPLEDAMLTNRVPLGVSNEFAAAEAEIALKTGVLMVVQTRI